MEAKVRWRIDKALKKSILSPIDRNNMANIAWLRTLYWIRTILAWQRIRLDNRI